VRIKSVSGEFEVKVPFFDEACMGEESRTLNITKENLVLCFSFLSSLCNPPFAQHYA
jgi:hypothetical protein